MKLGIFEQMKTRENITGRELGSLVNVDSNVIGQTLSESPVNISDYGMDIARVMRVLVAAGIVASKGEDAYSHTPKSLIYVKGEHTAVDSFNLL